MNQDWGCFYVEKEYGGEEDEVIWPHRPKQAALKMSTGDDGGQTMKGQTCKYLVPRLRGA